MKKHSDPHFIVSRTNTLKLITSCGDLEKAKPIKKIILIHPPKS